LELLAECYMNSNWLVGITSAVQYKLSNTWMARGKTTRAEQGQVAKDEWQRPSGFATWFTASWYTCIYDSPPWDRHHHRHHLWLQQRLVHFGVIPTIWTSSQSRWLPLQTSLTSLYINWKLRYGSSRDWWEMRGEDTSNRHLRLCPPHTNFDLGPALPLWFFFGGHRDFVGSGSERST